jgi:hypothetical protein
MVWPWSIIAGCGPIRLRETVRAPDRNRSLNPYRFAVRRSQQRRVPHQPGARRRSHQIIPPARTSTDFERDLSSAISGFRSLYGQKQRSFFLKATALRRTCVLEPFARGGSLCENSGRNPHFAGCRRPFTDVARNVVAPGEYSKWFFCIPIRHYRGSFRPATARGMPDRSALGGPADVNPAAAINSVTGPLWPYPVSTTSTPPDVSRCAACGISAR